MPRHSPPLPGLQSRLRSLERESKRVKGWVLGLVIVEQRRREIKGWIFCLFYYTLILIEIKIKGYYGPNLISGVLFRNFKKT